MTITIDRTGVEQRLSRNAGAALLLIEALAWVDGLSPADRAALAIADEMLASEWCTSGAEISRLRDDALRAGDYDPEYVAHLLGSIGTPPPGAETIIEAAVIGVLAARPKMGECLRIAMERGWSYGKGSIVPTQRTA